VIPRETATLRDRAAIVGVGWTEYSKNSGVSTLTLALRAIVAALEDAGLGPRDADGVACHRVGDSAAAFAVAQSLGIRDLRYHLDQFGGGSNSAGVVGMAAMAVASGTAECVVCWRSINARSEHRMGGTGRAPLVEGEFQYQAPYGFATPPQQFAMYTRAYLDAYGVPPEALGQVAIAQRAWAAQNERAMMQAPLTLDDYLASRWIVEPLRLLDCCLETDAAVALVVTSPDRAAHLRQVPVLIAGAAFGGGHTLYSNGHQDLTTTAAAEMAPRLFASAGVTPSEIDVLELYDAFTPLVLLQLEDYGFCSKGEAAELVASGCTRPGGSLPVNTHGGHLSEGYVHGLNHVAEAVSQLRWDAGPRQVQGAELALTTGQPGYVAGTSSALVLRRAT
jgi:acetyl-CoA acetyltransferase